MVLFAVDVHKAATSSSLAHDVRHRSVSLG
jgi:hypothetical protein